MSSRFSRRALLLGSAAVAVGPGLTARTIHAQDDAVPPFATPSALPVVESRADGALKISTSTSILADLARQIGGERVEVTSILPANADPHDFEPSPDDVIEIEDADLIVLHGLQLDTWADSLIESAQTDAPVVVATVGIETIGGDHEGGDHDEEDHDHDFDMGDPHVWFDPMRAKQMAANIRDGLAALDPDGATGYQERYEAYAAELDRLDHDIRERIELIPEDRRIMVTNHDALAYYAERYGLTIVGTVIPGLDSRTEPSAKDVVALIERVEESGVSVIFAENTVDPALAESLAADTGIRVAPDLYTDSLGDEGSGADTYIGLMQTDTLIIVENLRDA
ncbi:MAG: zinc ABC transporter substrate-binding protein [Thermomicrobiales bacterium]